MYSNAESVVQISGVLAEKVGRDAAETLDRNIQHGGCVDEFFQDQVRFTADPKKLSGHPTEGKDHFNPLQTTAEYLPVF